MITLSVSRYRCVALITLCQTAWRITKKSRSVRFQRNTKRPPAKVPPLSRLDKGEKDLTQRALPLSRRAARTRRRLDRVRFPRRVPSPRNSRRLRPNGTPVPQLALSSNGAIRPRKTLTNFTHRRDKRKALNSLICVIKLKKKKTAELSAKNAEFRQLYSSPARCTPRPRLHAEEEADSHPGVTV